MLPTRRIQPSRTLQLDPGPPPSVPTLADILGYDLNSTTGVYGWFRADYNLTVDVNNNVTTWNNIIAANPSMSFTNGTVTATNSPTRVASGINGKPSLNFNGTTQRLVTPSFTVKAQPLWQFIVFDIPATTATGSRCIIDGIQPGTTRTATYYLDSTKLPRLASATIVNGTSPAYVVGSKYVITAKYASPSSFLKINNGAVTGLTAATTGTQGTTGNTLGAFFNLLAGSFANIRIAEVIMCDSTFASESTVYALLAARYGV